MRGESFYYLMLHAAGSVVTKDVPAGELWMGHPAKFYRKVDF